LASTTVSAEAPQQKRGGMGAILAAITVLLIAGGAIAAWQMGLFNGSQADVSMADAGAANDGAAAEDTGRADVDDPPADRAADVRNGADGVGRADQQRDEADSVAEPDSAAGNSDSVALAATADDPQDQQNQQDPQDQQAADTNQDAVADAAEPADDNAGDQPEVMPAADAKPPVDDKPAPIADSGKGSTLTTAPTLKITELPADIKTLMASPNPRDRAAALGQMTGYSSPEIIGAVRKSLGDQLPLVRGAAMDLAGAKGGRTYMGMLAKAFGNESSANLRLKAIRILKNKGGARAKSAFVTGLSDSSVQVRQIAAKGLARYAGDSDRANLERCAADSDAQVAATCSGALSKLAQ